MITGKTVAAIGDFEHRASLPSASLPSYPVTLTKRFKQAAEAAGTTSPEATMGIVCIRGDAEPSLIRLFLAGFSHGSNRWFE
jgi:hypothetical protein